jgi:hypothetical protein
MRSRQLRQKRNLRNPIRNKAPSPGRAEYAAPHGAWFRDGRCSTNMSRRWRLEERSLRFRMPKGFSSFSPGLERSDYPGSITTKTIPNPNGVASLIHLDGFNPFRVAGVIDGLLSEGRLHRPTLG